MVKLILAGGDFKLPKLKTQRTSTRDLGATIRGPWGRNWKKWVWGVSDFRPKSAIAHLITKGCLKKLSFTELRVSIFVTNIISISSQLSAGSSNAQFGKTRILRHPVCIVWSELNSCKIFRFFNSVDFYIHETTVKPQYIVNVHLNSYLPFCALM